MKETKKYYVDKNLILGTISYKGMNVKEFCKELGCSRVNFYVAINRTYLAPRSVFISKVVKKLGIDETLVWNKE